MSPSNLKISCLICVHSTNYQYDHLLRRCLLSVINQSRPPNEIIIVLDSCWPNTQNFINELWRETHCSIELKLITHTKSGLADAKNEGIKHCSGDWICYCDADDYWHNTKLEIQENFVKNISSEYDIIATESWDVNQNGFIYPNCFLIGQYRTHEQIASRLRSENVICHGSVLIRKSIFDKLSGYSDNKGREDYDLWLHALAYGFKFYKIPERLYYWSHGTSVAR